MDQKSSSTMAWIFGGVFAGMLGCLCTIATIAGAGMILLRATPTPTVYVIPPTEPPPVNERDIEMLQELSQTIVPLADQVDLAERLLGLEDLPRILATSAEPVPLGSIEEFWVSNSDIDEYFPVSAEMVYATDHVYFWIEQGVDYNLQEVEALVDDFEYNTYPVTREFFGSEWRPGIDGDEHLYILVSNGLGVTTAGYYGSNDELAPEVHNTSNAHEMFYLAGDLSFSSEFTYGVLAHEFQHMIHWYLDANEETWLNEGFAELASLLAGYDPGGADFSYAQDPDLPLTYWPSDGSYPHYGQAYLFVAYYMGRLGSDATQALVSHPANGLDSVDMILDDLGITDPETDEQLTADDLYRDWAAAFLLQDETILDGRYSMPTLPIAPIPSYSDQYDDCPISDQFHDVNQYGIDFIRIRCRTPQTLTFDGTTLVKVVPGEAHSGDYAVWSNRGDHSNMTFSRTFDFSDVQGQIEFDYWVWFDIEEDWDYLYLVASADGGETWEILATPSATDTDPTGNSYGWAYTGFSGRGTEPTWIQESVDLTRFAGQEVILRFEYVTDAAVNGEGLLLDDLSIDAIGYSEDFEQGYGGWEAAGFVRLFNSVPQTYIVLLIEYGDEVVVREIELDEMRHAEVPIEFSRDMDEVALIVIGTSRYTWTPAPYWFSLEP
jgi:hypothetical protein